MSETQTAPEAEPNPINLSSIFNKKPAVEVEPVNDNPKKEKAEAPKEKTVKKEVKQVEEDVDTDDEDVSDKKEASKPPEIDYKSEYEKQLKIIKDTQKSFHENNKKLSAYKKAVEKLKEDGALLDEEATLLLNHTHYDEVPEDEPLIVKYGKIWDKEADYMRKYAPNPKEIDQHILAFQHFMQTASAQELNDVLSDLSQYEEDEVEFTRQMLEVGRQYNDDIYADISNAGSIRQLKAKYSEKEAELQKKIDNLEEKVNEYKEKYEDYDDRPGNLNLPTGSGNHKPSSKAFDLAKVFAKPYQSNNRF